MDCPDPETLEQWFSGELSTERRTVLADHAAGCRDCHQLLELLLDSGALATTAGVTAATAAPEVRGFDLHLSTGVSIDRYVIERRIGHGGMGVVYAARDPELGRGVAIKVLRAGAPRDRLRREAQALAKLSHPNVVAVHDVGEHDGRTFIAMALVDGVTLRAWLEQPRTVGDTLEVLRAAGRGIAAAHAAGMIHRDLKPDNVFIARDGGVLVGDFGLARDVEVADDVDLTTSNETPVAMTATGMILGTPAYMAPEQAKGEATAASDQFAFCITAWEALYGERPFPGNNFAALQTSIAAGTITKPAEDRDIPATIERALRRGLAADPANRFESMAALLHELAPHRRRWRWPWLVASAALIATVIVALSTRGHATEPCATEHLLDGVWSVAQHPETPTRTGLDAYAKRWLAARHEVCMMRDELGPAVVEARTRCLDQDRLALAALVDAIGTAADPFTALHAIEQLPPIDACAHVAVNAKTPAMLANGIVLAVRVTDVEARYNLMRVVPAEQLRSLVDSAQRIGDDAMLVRALLLEAEGYEGSGQPDLAEPVLRLALLAAERSGEDLARVRTRIALALVLTKLQRLAEARNALDEASTVLSRFGGDHDQGFELVLANAMLAAARGDHSEAIALLRQYVTAREQDHEQFKLATGYIYLAGEMASWGDHAEAAAVMHKLGLLEAATGNEHATVFSLDSEATAAQNNGQFTRAIELVRQAYAIVLTSAHTAKEEASILFSLAAAYELGSDWPNMQLYNEKRLALLPEDPALERAYVMENLGVAHSRMGQGRPAVAWLTKAIALYIKIGPPADPQNAKIALAIAFVQTGQFREARALGEQLLPEVIASEPPRPWRRGSTEYSLCRSLWEVGDARERAHALVIAADAERDFVDAIDQLSKIPIATSSVAIIKARLADLRAWRAKH